MKLFLGFLRQVVILPALISYRLLSNTGDFKRLGNGSGIIKNCSTEALSQMFWVFLILLVVGISVFSLSRIAKWYYKLIYLFFFIVISILIVLQLYYSMQ